MMRQLARRALSLGPNPKPYDFCITTPIFYVNSSPHIGHLHTILVADAINIFNRLRLKSDRTLFTSGTDEHGIKIRTAATASGLDCQSFCDSNSAKYRGLFDSFDTTLTDFIRTTEDRHKKSVKSVWLELMKNGFIYKSSYSGWYCISDETFVPESQVTKKTTDHGIQYFDQNDNVVTWSTEENYLFRLSYFTDRIRSWLINNKPIVPEKFNSEALSMLDRTSIGDISISRPSSRSDWAIPVPNDPSQTIYVWLDALSNYLTSVGYPDDVDLLKRWPIDCQVIGKDIIKFHAIYWPAFLLALSLPLPKQLICHSHWLLESLKMSKSRGNVVDPYQESSILSSEGLRYYLLRCGTPHSDTDYNRTQAIRLVNAELADTFGNLLSRCCAPAINPDQTIPVRLSGNADKRVIELKEHLDELSKICELHYQEADFYKGLNEVMRLLRFNNSLYEESKPWKLVKEMIHDDSVRERYENLQAITFENLRICSIMLLPIVPSVAKSALEKLDATNCFWSEAKTNLKSGPDRRLRNNKVNTVLFKKIKS